VAVSSSASRRYRRDAPPRLRRRRRTVRMAWSGRSPPCATVSRPTGTRHL